MTPAHDVTGERLLERILHLSFSEHLFYWEENPKIIPITYSPLLVCYIYPLTLINYTYLTMQSTYSIHSNQKQKHTSI